MAIVVFDVNETLLSLAPVGDALAEVFGKDPPAGEWFARLLHLSAVVDDLDAHVPFDEVAVHALRRVAAGHGVEVSADTAREVCGVMRHLPAHDDVDAGLGGLAAAGHDLVAFSNSAPDVLAGQLAHAGIDHHFDTVVSVEVAGRFKPDRRSYEGLASRLDAFTEELTMVAAHDWDVAGAMAAGLSGVFLERTPDTWQLPVRRPVTVTAVGDLVEVV